MNTEVQEFLRGVEVKYDAFREWIDAMNGPLPAEKVELTELPQLACDSRRPAPKEIPVWSLA
jgi:hypothetical protein